MLIANYGRSAMPTLMGLAGSAEITKLQQALVNLAQATNKPQLNPGRVDGVLDNATMSCVASAFTYAASEIPGWLGTALNLALIGGSATETAKNYVSQYASQLAVAFNAAAIKYKSSSVPSTPSAPVTLPVPASAWYKTWWGMLGIGLGAALILKYILGPRPAAQ